MEKGLWREDYRGHEDGRKVCLGLGDRRGAGRPTLARWTAHQVVVRVLP